MKQGRGYFNVLFVADTRCGSFLASLFHRLLRFNEFEAGLITVLGEPKMPDFKRIRASLWHASVAHLREAVDDESYQPCYCLPASAGGTSCRTSECVNRGCSMECVPALCPCGEECMNQDIQRGTLPNVECVTRTAPDWFKQDHVCNQLRIAAPHCEAVSSGQFAICWHAVTHPAQHHDLEHQRKYNVSARSAVFWSPAQERCVLVPAESASSLVPRAWVQSHSKISKPMF